MPKDWTVIYSIRETQQTSNLFQNSDRFDPDRWERIEEITKDTSTDPTKFHYIPFGFGARGCVGKAYAQLAMKVFLIELVQASNWSLKNKNVEMVFIPIAMPLDHLPATFVRNSDAICNWNN